jgi:hypothetical protein
MLQVTYLELLNSIKLSRIYNPNYKFVEQIVEKKPLMNKYKDDSIILPFERETIIHGW